MKFPAAGRGLTDFRFPFSVAGKPMAGFLHPQQDCLQRAKRALDGITRALVDQGAIDVLPNTDLICVHVEAPDEAGHQGLLQEKIQAIEDFDQKIVQPLFEGINGKYTFRVAVTCDHFTPISTKTHDAQPVPVAIYDSQDQSSGSGLAFSEENARSFNFHLTNGEKFINELLQR